MDGAPNTDLNISTLNPISKEFANELFNWKPEWKQFCSMDITPYGNDLRARIPSPSGNKNLDILIWFANDADDLSLSFGGNHIHGNFVCSIPDGTFETWSILATLKAIVSGDLVTFTDASKPGKFLDWIYLPSKSQIEDELTNPHCSDAIQLYSWDGIVNRVTTLSDITRG